MGSISQIVKQTTQHRGGHDDRAALRLAISRRHEASDALAAHKAAIQRAHKLVDKAEAKAEKAKAGIGEAKVAAARLAAEQISRGKDEASTNGVIRAARMARSPRSMKSKVSAPRTSSSGPRRPSASLRFRKPRSALRSPFGS